MKEHELRSGKSVDRPYARVRDIIASDPAGLFQRATSAAAELHPATGATEATLSVTAFGRELQKEVHVEITSLDTSGRPPSAMALPGFAVAFRWRAVSAASLFPSLRAVLTAYPLSPTTTQLDLHGWYKLPGGALGALGDALNHHQLAEASIEHFLDDVVRRLAIDAA
jgi:hypothetical protein